MALWIPRTRTRTRPLSIFTGEDGGPARDEARLSEQPEQGQQREEEQHSNLSIPAIRHGHHMLSLVKYQHIWGMYAIEHQTLHHIISLEISLCWAQCSVLFFDDLFSSLAMERVCPFHKSSLTPLETEGTHVVNDTCQDYMKCLWQFACSIDCYSQWITANMRTH